MQEFTGSQASGFIAERYGWYAATAIPQVNAWLQRGDGIAFYVNSDLGSPDAGDLRMISYGSAAAQIESNDVPTTLPDGIGGSVNWRYQLEAIYRGDALAVPANLPEPPEDEYDNPCDDEDDDYYGDPYWGEEC